MRLPAAPRRHRGRPGVPGHHQVGVAFGALLAEGIGDTIRVSLSAPPVEEIKVGNQILESLGLRERGLEIVSCPSCGRAQVDVYKLAEEVTAGLEGLPVPLRVAVMGCVVNGPGEARETDIGITGGGAGKHMVYLSGVTDHHINDAAMVDHIVALVEAKAAEIEAAKIEDDMSDAGMSDGSQGAQAGAAVAAE